MLDILFLLLIVFFLAARTSRPWQVAKGLVEAVRNFRREVSGRNEKNITPDKRPGR